MDSKWGKDYLVINFRKHSAHCQAISINFKVYSKQAISDAKATSFYWVLIIHSLPATPSKSENEWETDVKQYNFSVGSCSQLSEKAKNKKDSASAFAFAFALAFAWTIWMH